MESSQESGAVKAAMNILRNTPASDADQNRSRLEQLLSSNPDALYELTSQHVSLPLQTAKDATTGKPYVVSSFNHLPHGTYHAQHSSDNNNNAMEAHFSELWDTYTQMYYGTTAVGSVHLLSEHPLQACFLLQNVTQEGQWNSIHIVHVKNTMTTVQSTVFVMIGNDISAHVTRATSRKLPLLGQTTTNTMEIIGPLLEEVETNIRSSLEQVQLPKTLDILSELTKKKKSLVGPNTTTMGGMNHTAMLNQAVLARAAAMQKKN